VNRREAKRWHRCHTHVLQPDGSIRVVDRGMQRIPLGLDRLAKYYDFGGRYFGTLAYWDEKPLGRRAEVARRKPRGGRKRR
jgi:hypothetical protein